MDVYVISVAIYPQLSLQTYLCFPTHPLLWNLRENVTKVEFKNVTLILYMKIFKTPYI